LTIMQQVPATAAAAPLGQPMRYLDKAMTALRDLGLPLPMLGGAEENPITGLLGRISDLDPDRVALIARVLVQATAFNEMVREQIRAVEIGERYEQITGAFNSIRDDAREMVKQVEDGRLSTMERLSNVWQKVMRGDVADRFDRIRSTYVEVSRDTKDQVERERAILEAYRDFRGAMKEAEVMAFEVLQKAQTRLETARQRMDEASKAVEAASAATPARACPPGDGRDEAPARASRRRRGCTRSPKDLSGQPHRVLQHVGGDHGAAGADHQRQGAVWQQSVSVLLDQRGGA
jgi:hypothetical protein